jgi:hypothetical protein
MWGASRRALEVTGPCQRLEWTRLLVGGNIVARGIDCGFQFICAGAIKAPVVCVDGTGKLSCQRLQARLLIEIGYDHSVCTFAPWAITYRRRAWVHGRWRQAHRAMEANLGVRIGVRACETRKHRHNR